jgi:hypothetical protein
VPVPAHQTYVSRPACGSLMQPVCGPRFQGLTSPPKSAKRRPDLQPIADSAYGRRAVACASAPLSTGGVGR